MRSVFSILVKDKPATKRSRATKASKAMYVPIFFEKLSINSLSCDYFRKLARLLAGKSCTGLAEMARDSTATLCLLECSARCFALLRLLQLPRLLVSSKLLNVAADKYLGLAALLAFVLLILTCAIRMRLCLWCTGSKAYKANFSDGDEDAVKPGPSTSTKSKSKSKASASASGANSNTAGTGVNATTATANTTKSAQSKQAVSTPHVPQPENAEELFNKYVDEAEDGDDEGQAITAEGLERLYEDAGIPLDGAMPWIMAWQFGAEEMLRFSREEWLKGMSALGYVYFPVCSVLLTCSPFTVGRQADRWEAVYIVF